MGIGVGAVAYFILQGILRPTILKWASAPRFLFLFAAGVRVEKTTMIMSKSPFKQSEEQFMKEISYQGIANSKHPFLIGMALFSIIKHRQQYKEPSEVNTLENDIQDLVGYSIYAFSRVPKLQNDPISDLIKEAIFSSIPDQINNRRPPLLDEIEAAMYLLIVIRNYSEQTA